MNAHVVAVLLAGFILVSISIAPLAVVAYWVHIGKVRRSDSATRGEKNLRHLITVLTLALAAAIGVIALFWDRRTGIVLLSGTAIFAAYGVPLRTIFVELGLRRVPRNPQDSRA